MSLKRRRKKSQPYSQMSGREQQVECWLYKEGKNEPLYDKPLRFYIGNIARWWMTDIGDISYPVLLNAIS
jgi:hypothetical protein